MPNLLNQDDVELAAVAVNGDVLLYHYANESTLPIRELNISGTPGSRSSPETFNLEDASIVAQPALIADGQPALYQPLGAVLTNATGVEPSIYVSWVEHNIGANNSYDAMTVVSGKISDEKWPDSTYRKGARPSGDTPWQSERGSSDVKRYTFRPGIIPATESAVLTKFWSNCSPQIPLTLTISKPPRTKSYMRKGI